MSQLTTLLDKLGPVAKQVLGTFAPTVLKAAGGPFGALAGTALQAIFGSNDPAAIDTALVNATPDQIIALKKAEQDFQVQMRQLGIQEEDLYLKDVADARAMQVATRDPNAGRLAWLVVGGFLVIACFECVAMVAWPAQWAAIPAAALNMLGIIFGFMANEAKQASAFYFGSSAGSQAKDQILGEIAKQ
jgi:hypothetical protein